MRSYDLGNPDLDQQVRDLVAAASENDNQDLIVEMITTVLKLHRDGSVRGDLKLINTALKEMRYSNLVFSRHTEPKVTIFGSARLPAGDPNYAMAESFASKMAERGWGVITGAGPGIMEAGSRGAGVDAGYGVKIRLPFEAEPNAFIAPERTVNFKYFFTRKLAFVKESHGFALFPGGFGTLDETFELMTLVQTGKSDIHPIVLIEAPGSGYWEEMFQFVRTTLVDHGLIAASDLDLLSLTSDVDAAVEELCGFYANYQSQRYVDGALMLRMVEAPTAQLLAELNAEFADIVVEGAIEVVEPSPAEVRDDDALDLARVRLAFDRRQFGRLRRLIDRLNRGVEVPRAVRPPAVFGSQQADREW
jgi:uncharacterized protein (TIGR00730 family)